MHLRPDTGPTDGPPVRKLILFLRVYGRRRGTETQTRPLYRRRTPLQPSSRYLSPTPDTGAWSIRTGRNRRGTMRLLLHRFVHNGPNCNRHCGQVRVRLDRQSTPTLVPPFPVWMPWGGVTGYVARGDTFRCTSSLQGLYTDYVLF